MTPDHSPVMPCLESGFFGFHHTVDSALKVLSELGVSPSRITLRMDGRGLPSRWVVAQDPPPGSDLGPGVTALRAQLSGRICHRVNDPETANMTLGDLDPAALDAARLIPANTPGVAIVAGDSGAWHRARSALVTDDQAEHAAATYSHLTPDWAVLTGRPRPVPSRNQDEAA